ncbi:MAG: sigma-70 family RNA polymerase sigma factor [Actinobacteria bacterium]|nr:sigma-70 family RNA polymerase sigma factor [Actinomycetota bacterium]
MAGLMKASVEETELREVIQAARDGHPEAFARLVRIYHGPVLGVCTGYVRDRWAAEDLAQEAFLRAYTHIDSLRNGESFWPWLRQIARTTCLMALRRVDSAPTEAAGSEVAESPGGGDGGTGPLFLRDLLHRLLAALPEDQRVPLLLHYFHGMPYREIAGLLDLPENLVRSRLFEGRRRLRGALQKEAEAVLRQSGPRQEEIDALVARCTTSACRCGRILLEP